MLCVCALLQYLLQPLALPIEVVHLLLKGVCLCYSSSAVGWPLANRYRALHTTDKGDVKRAQQ